MSEQVRCGLCGEPMPPGEEMFQYHGYSGDCPKPPLVRVKTGVQLIAEERTRQIEAEGWTPAHDDKHCDGELVAAAICYAEVGSGFDLNVSPRDGAFPTLYPWEASSWKPSSDLVRNLTKAGALIAAEIDRLQRETD